MMTRFAGRMGQDIRELDRALYWRTTMRVAAGAVAAAMAPRVMAAGTESLLFPRNKMQGDQGDVCKQSGRKTLHKAGDRGLSASFFKG